MILLCLIVWAFVIEVVSLACCVIEEIWEAGFVAGACNTALRDDREL